MKIGTSSPGLPLPKATASPASAQQGKASSFDAHFAQAQSIGAMPESAGAQKQVGPDFTHLTKAEFVAWGKEAFARGHISLDDLFHVQSAGGDFDGTLSSDTQSHDFVAFFNGLIDNEVKAHRATGYQSMVPTYRHLLASMERLG